MKYRFLIAAAFMMFMGQQSARADYSFAFSSDGGATTGTTFSFDATQGPLVLSLYLVQSGSDTGLSDVGLKSGGVKLNYDGTVISTSSAAITPNRAADGGQFQLGSKSVTGSGTSNAFATVRSFNSSGPAVVAPTSGTDANRILLGTFTFNGLTVGSTSVLTLDPSVTNDNVLQDNTVLDGIIDYNTTASVTVTAVPEPGTMALGGLLAAGILGTAARRFRRPPASIA